MPIEFRFLDRPLWESARLLANCFANERYSVQVETSLSPDYSFRPTFLMKKRGAVTHAIEIRSTIKVEDYFRDFVLECERAREPTCISLAVPSSTSEPLSITIETDRALRDLGIGVYLIESGGLSILRRARMQSHRFVVPPGPTLGKYDQRIQDVVAKHNDGFPVDAIRDITEFVEEAIRDLARKASGKGRMNLPRERIDGMSLEKLIDCLSASNSAGKPQSRVLDTTLSSDLRSFKGARNLSHHPRTPAKERQLYAQVHERMEMAVRLLREIRKMHRNV